jgi:hypothetical protein
MAHDRQPMQTWLSIEEDHATIARRCQLGVRISALVYGPDSLSVVKMPLNRIADSQILCHVFYVGKLQRLLESSFFVNHIIRSGMFVRPVKNGSTKPVDVVVRYSFWVSQLSGNLDGNRDLEIT